MRDPDLALWNLGKKWVFCATRQKSVQIYVIYVSCRIFVIVAKCCLFWNANGILHHWAKFCFSHTSVLTNSPGLLRQESKMYAIDMLIFEVMLNSSHWQHVKNIYAAVIKSVFFLSYRKLVKNPNAWLWNCIHSFLTDVELKMPVSYCGIISIKGKYSLQNHIMQNQMQRKFSVYLIPCR